MPNRIPPSKLSYDHFSFCASAHLLLLSVSPCNGLIIVILFQIVCCLCRWLLLLLLILMRYLTLASITSSISDLKPRATSQIACAEDKKKKDTFEKWPFCLTNWRPCLHLLSALAISSISSENK